MPPHIGKGVYVTSYDDTVTRIDTATLAIDGSVEVGRDPDGICIKKQQNLCRKFRWTRFRYKKL